jgi:hypothetical protein
MASAFLHDPWMTLSTFASREEMDVVRAMLESAGIQCFCPEQYMSSYYGIGMQARLQVRESQFEEARAMLESPFKMPDPS